MMIETIPESSNYTKKLTIFRFNVSCIQLDIVLLYEFHFLMNREIFKVFVHDAITLTFFVPKKDPVLQPTRT